MSTWLRAFTRFHYLAVSARDQPEINMPVSAICIERNALSSLSVYDLLPDALGGKSVSVIDLFARQPSASCVNNIAIMYNRVPENVLCDVTCKMCVQITGF